MNIENKAVYDSSRSEHKSRLSPFLLEEIGFREIPTDEVTIAPELAYGAYRVRTALRLGADSIDVIDPEAVITTVDIDLNRVTLFKQLIVATSKNKDLSKLILELFPDSNEIRVRGILRRVVQSKTFSKLKLHTPLNLALALQVFEEEIKQKEINQGKPVLLLVAHTAPPDYQAICNSVFATNTEASIKNGKLTDRIGDFIQAGLMTQAAPSLAASVLAVEAEEAGYQVITLDYDKVNDMTLEQLKIELNISNFDIAMISGVTSFDVGITKAICAKLADQNIPTVVGGIAPTIDPNYFILNTQASVMIGEGEDAVNPIITQMLDSHGSKRTVFTRRGYVSKKTKMVEIPGVERVDLEIDQLVNLEEYYSEINEKRRLGKRIKYEYLMMEPIFNFNKWWEMPRTLIDPMQISRWCPLECEFCSTAWSIGHKPRRIPISSIELMVQASEAGGFLIVDQNLLAVRQNASQKELEQWHKYMLALFGAFKAGKKMIAIQSDLSFANRIEQFPELQKLVSEVVVAMLVGLEQPKKVKGSGQLKVPENFEAQIQTLRNMGILVVGTAIPGLDTSDSALSPQEFAEWLQTLGVTPIPFPRVDFPGTFDVVTQTSTDTLYEDMFNPQSLEAFITVSKELYSVKSIFSRIQDMFGGNYSYKKIVFNLLFNLAFGAIYKQGFYAFTDEAQATIELSKR